MIIESKIKATNADVLIDDYSLCSIEENNGNGTTIWLYGKTTPTIITKPFDEMKKLFIDSKKRDRISEEEKPKYVKIRMDINTFIDSIENELFNRIRNSKSDAEARRLLKEHHALQLNKTTVIASCGLFRKII